MLLYPPSRFVCVDPSLKYNQDFSTEIIVYVDPLYNIIKVHVLVFWCLSFIGYTYYDVMYQPSLKVHT